MTLEKLQIGAVRIYRVFRLATASASVNDVYRD